MDQKTCLVTGATSGIGKAAALALAKKGFRVILLGRNEARAAQSREEIRRRSNRPEVTAYACDLSLLREVRGLVLELGRGGRPIDVLINNAGARFLEHRLTDEGIEKTLATNHLGHFVLTLGLIEMLARSGDGRIINVASGAHFSGTRVIENVLSPGDYDGRRQYADSKLANVLFTYALAERLKGRSVTVNAVDPGPVATNFARNDGWLPWLRHRIYHLAKGHLRSSERGAETIVHLASAAGLAGVTGRYFFDRRPILSSRLSYDGDIQRALWMLSARLSGLDL